MERKGGKGRVRKVDGSQIDLCGEKAAFQEEKEKALRALHGETTEPQEVKARSQQWSRYKLPTPLSICILLRH